MGGICKDCDHEIIEIWYFVPTKKGIDKTCKIQHIEHHCTGEKDSYNREKIEARATDECWCGCKTAAYK